MVWKQKGCRPFRPSVHPAMDCISLQLTVRWDYFYRDVTQFDTTPNKQLLIYNKDFDVVFLKGFYYMDLSTVRVSSYVAETSNSIMCIFT